MKVDVIQCKCCKFYNDKPDRAPKPYCTRHGVAGGFVVEPEGYCAWAERKAEPDTQERIDADVKKTFNEYWGCDEKDCSECPTKIGGLKPNEFYEVNTCWAAQAMDLLRRQRELDGVQ